LEHLTSESEALIEKRKAGVRLRLQVFRLLPGLSIWVDSDGVACEVPNWPLKAHTGDQIRSRD